METSTLCRGVSLYVHKHVLIYTLNEFYLLNNMHLVGHSTVNLFINGERSQRFKGSVSRDFRPLFQSTLTQSRSSRSQNVLNLFRLCPLNQNQMWICCYRICLSGGRVQEGWIQETIWKFKTLWQSFNQDFSSVTRCFSLNCWQKYMQFKTCQVNEIFSLNQFRWSKNS